MSTQNEPNKAPKSTKKGTSRYIYHTRIWPQIGQPQSSDWLLQKYLLRVVVLRYYIDRERANAKPGG